MYGLIKVGDHKIVAINRRNATIIVHRDKQLHTIDLKVCSENFKNEYPTASEKCIGDRNIKQKYFILYTSERNTIISFKKKYVFNLFGKNILYGTRTQRFMQLQNMLTQLGYSTYDLT